MGRGARSKAVVVVAVLVAASDPPCKKCVVVAALRFMGLSQGTRERLLWGFLRHPPSAPRLRRCDPDAP